MLTRPSSLLDATQPNPPANAERATQFLSPKIVAREAAKVLADLGLEIRPAAVRILAKRFVEAGHTTTAELHNFARGYVDPTGDQAARNVDRQRGTA